MRIENNFGQEQREPWSQSSATDNVENSISISQYSYHFATEHQQLSKSQCFPCSCFNCDYERKTADPLIIAQFRWEGTSHYSVGIVHFPSSSLKRT
jgi:hypothetical protein